MTPDKWSFPELVLTRLINIDKKKIYVMSVLFIFNYFVYFLHARNNIVESNTPLWNSSFLVKTVRSCVSKCNLEYTVM